MTEAIAVSGSNEFAEFFNGLSKKDPFKKEINDAKKFYYKTVQMEIK